MLLNEWMSAGPANVKGAWQAAMSRIVHVLARATTVTPFRNNAERRPPWLRLHGQHLKPLIHRRTGNRSVLLDFKRCRGNKESDAFEGISDRSAARTVNGVSV